MLTFIKNLQFFFFPLGKYLVVYTYNGFYTMNRILIICYCTLTLLTYYISRTEKVRVQEETYRRSIRQETKATEFNVLYESSKSDSSYASLKARIPK